jgi:hypothetical protein
MQRIAIEDSTSNGARDTTNAFAKPSAQPLLVRIQPQVDRPPIADFADPTDSGSQSGADGTTYGRYIAQISARIDRAWLRPRTLIGSPVFVCRTAVTQDGAGNVLEIAIEHCNGDAHWQRSLAAAIQSASPLPSPPDPSVFRRTVHLEFRSEPFSADVSPELYEPAPTARTSGIGSRNDAQSSLTQFVSRFNRSHPNQVVNLSLVGTPSSKTAIAPFPGTAMPAGGLPIDPTRPSPSPEPPE